MEGGGEGRKRWVPNPWHTRFLSTRPHLVAQGYSELQEAGQEPDRGLTFCHEVTNPSLEVTLGRPHGPHWWGFRSV